MPDHLSVSDVAGGEIVVIAAFLGENSQWMESGPLDCRIPTIDWLKTSSKASGGIVQSLREVCDQSLGES